MPSIHVQRTPEGTAAALLPGPNLLLVAGTHRNMSAVNETETVTDTAELDTAELDMAELTSPTCRVHFRKRPQV
jgi:hypothetical protein